MTEKPALDDLQGSTAGFVTRMLAYLIDALVLTVVLALGGWLAVAIDTLFDEAGVDLRFAATTIYAALTPWIIAGYYVIFWSLTGRTVGKALLGVKVVMSNGRPPTIGRSVLRLIGYAISTLVFFAGYLWIIIDDNRKGWHDHMAGTWVVYDWRTRRRGEIYKSMTEDA